MENYIPLSTVGYWGGSGPAKNILTTASMPILKQLWTRPEELSLELPRYCQNGIQQFVTRYYNLNHEEIQAVNVRGDVLGRLDIFAAKVDLETPAAGRKRGQVS